MVLSFASQHVLWVRRTDKEAGRGGSHITPVNSDSDIHRRAAAGEHPSSRPISFDFYFMGFFGHCCM